MNNEQLQKIIIKSEMEYEQMKDSILDLKEKVILLNNKIKEYEVNTIPTLEHNIDVLVDSEDRLNNIINELEKYINNQLMMTREFDKYNEGYIDATLHYYNKLKALEEDNK